MEPKWFEDFEVGETFSTHGRTVTEADLVAFTNLSWSTMPIHSDVEYIKKSTPFRERLVHGPFTLAVVEGLLSMTGFMTGRALGLLVFEEVKFPSPVHPGDTVYAENTVLAKRDTSNPERGILTLLDRGINQRGEVVVECRRKILYRKKPKETPLINS